MIHEDKHPLRRHFAKTLILTPVDPLKTSNLNLDPSRNTSFFGFMTPLIGGVMNSELDGIVGTVSRAQIPLHSYYKLRQTDRDLGRDGSCDPPARLPPPVVPGLGRCREKNVRVQGSSSTTTQVSDSLSSVPKMYVTCDEVRIQGRSSRIISEPAQRLG